MVGASDFSFSGLHVAGNTSNEVGSRVEPSFCSSATWTQYSWDLNGQDRLCSVVDQPSPHTLVPLRSVLEGSLEVGFFTSNPDNSLISKVLYKGDVFVFPVGLVHFQHNAGNSIAVAIVALSSQNPGVIPIAAVVFGSKPDIATDILTKAFQIDKSVIVDLQTKF